MVNKKRSPPRTHSVVGCPAIQLEGASQKRRYCNFSTYQMVLFTPLELRMYSDAPFASL
jgi:hypothetical protein